MSEKLPKMPEPAVMCDCGGNYYTASQVLSLQRDTWMRAMEVAAKVCDEHAMSYLNRKDAYAAGRLYAAEDIAAAIRALPMPEGGE
jgi:hypothetical protein